MSGREQTEQKTTESLVAYVAVERWLLLSSRSSVGFRYSGASWLMPFPYYSFIHNLTPISFGAGSPSAKAELLYCKADWVSFTAQ